MTESGLVVVKWSNWGKHRLYVNTVAEQRVGWLDLDTGERSLDLPQFASVFEAALEEVADIDERGSYSPRRTVTPPVLDLADRRPGEHLEAQIAATIEAGRELKPAVPGFEGKRAYSSWELGVLGERAVADELDRLVDLDPRWAFLNSIPVGTHKSDIDHLVVGPGGVFSINAKHHHGGTVWVGEDAFKVIHAWQHYVRDSRSEAARASSLLCAAAGADIAVAGLVVLVGVAKLTVAAQPLDVQVLEASELVDFLISRPTTIDRDAAAVVLSSARLSCTWR
ncbi:MAG: NERD domain-containing protein [Propionibacteriaceae bacterium]|nr:NERD domain-containing protein [Propionibacteriaceae bacterium]